MIEHIRDYVGYVAGVYPVKEPVVEIGSYLVPGQLELANMRPFFKDMDYTGCDMRRGPGVDRLEDIQSLRYADASIGTLLVLETLEHVENPFLAFSEIYRVLAPGGLLMISIPFYFPIHEFPNDYWRCTPNCLDLLLKQFNRLITWENAELHPTEAQVKPRTVFALACKGEFQPEAKKQITAYCKQQGHFFLPDRRDTDDDTHASGQVHRTHWRFRL